MDRKDAIWIKCMEFGSRLGCHQMEERSFSFKGYQFPVCARCTGVILGEVIAVILMLFKVKINTYLCIAMLLIMGLDWFIQFLKIKESNNIRRLITGTIAGVGLTYIYYYIFKFLINLLLKLF